jgi:hypothetical protein
MRFGSTGLGLVQAAGAYAKPETTPVPLTVWSLLITVLFLETATTRRARYEHVIAAARPLAHPQKRV